MLSALSKNQVQVEKPCNTIDTLVGAKTEIKGDITFSGGLRIDGKIRGNITAKGDANSTLVLSENAQIVGNVVAPHIISNGMIKGSVRASERIELQPKAEIAGDVYYKTLEMALGAVINGNLVREPGDGAARGTVTRLKPMPTGGTQESED
jgi:cytoskeletal protein CcmA (bactofilin family)